MMEQTRVFRLLRGYRDRPAVDLDAVALTLVKLSQLASDLDDVAEIEINPLLASPAGVIALDTRLRLADQARGIGRLAIRPYPAELERSIALDDGTPLLPPQDAYKLLFFNGLFCAGYSERTFQPTTNSPR
jgi:acetyltransferase